MKSLKCSDLGSKGGCDFEASGETNQEIIDQLFGHAAKSHKDRIASMGEKERQSILQKMNELLNKQN